MFQNYPNPKAEKYLRCVKSTQIRTRKNSVFGHFSHSGKVHSDNKFMDLARTPVNIRVGVLCNRS